MSSNEEKDKEEKAVSVLKDVNQKAADKPIDQAVPKDDQPSSEEAAEQVKGSDADIDEHVGFDDQPDSEEAAEESRGSDADTDKST
jgi:hypothetical protein